MPQSLGGYADQLLSQLDGIGGTVRLDECWSFCLQFFFDRRNYGTCVVTQWNGTVLAVEVQVLVVFIVIEPHTRPPRPSEIKIEEAKQIRQIRIQGIIAKHP
jgi:hypothetical protein